MSIAALLAKRPGEVILRDVRFSPDEVLEAALRYQAAKAALDDDRENGRHDHADRFTAPEVERAAYDLQTVCSPHLLWHEAQPLLDGIRTASDNARTAVGGEVPCARIHP